jgi:hypothetical protein
MAMLAKIRMGMSVNSNWVAIISILVAGVISPIIAMSTVRWQVSHAIDHDIQAERRKILDEAIVEVSRLVRATGHARAMWRHGRFDDTDETLDTLRVRSSAREGMLAAYGRICVRFGPESNVATTYSDMEQFIDALDVALRPFRGKELFSADHEQSIERETAKLMAARNEFIKAAHDAAVGHR